MRHWLISLLLLPFLVACAPARAPVPVGEIPKPRTLTPTEEQYGHEILSQLTQKFELDYSDKRLIKIQEVVDKLTTAAGASADPWHVYLFRDQNFKNAAATRGNHVFVWSGILDFVNNDDELAVILGHEIAHVLAGHTDPDPNEEIKRVLVQVGAMAAGIAVGQVVRSPSFGQTASDLTSSVTESIGNGILVNPFARDLEYEADQIGLFLMADAGFNPEAAVSFWSRMQNSPDFGGEASFFSTHPSSTDRLARIENMLPAAKSRWQNGGYAVKAQPLPSYDKPYARSTNSRSNTNSSGISNATPPMGSDYSSSVTTNRDTFDLRSQNPRQSYVRWRVTAGHAIVYEKRTRKSRALGEFRRDSLIDIVGSRGDWLEVNYPDHGFIERSTATLETVALEVPARTR